MREYFETAWRAYRRLRPSVAPEPPRGLFDSFARLRPLVESGWEMPLVIHAVLAGASEAELLSGWRPEAWRRDIGVPRDTIAAELDSVRDEWITADEQGWLDHHRFYPGVIERVRRVAGGPTRVAVVTTKEGRFALKLLRRQGVRLDPDRVVGKEARRPKREILKDLVARHAAGDAARLWFVEDRLKTLEDAARDPALDGARLFLAEWGYNTPEERETARRDERIIPLSLARFARDFPVWLEPGS
ncbi:MAG: HAD family hydrolase [Candidatus Rokubacteria bacterium]|nr:HAD family hydrolase [Candidatus Rokubacteria bacterium]